MHNRSTGISRVNLCEGMANPWNGQPWNGVFPESYNVESGLYMRFAPWVVDRVEVVQWNFEMMFLSSDSTLYNRRNADSKLGH